jgi:hypothetical protein
MATADGILSKYENGVSSLGFKLRKFLLTELEHISEYPDGAANIIGWVWVGLQVIGLHHYPFKERN